RRIGAVIDEALAPLGLGSQQFSLLCLIASADDDTFGALAERAGLNASTMTRNVDVLARAGWVEVAQHGSDRRRRAIWLTEAGARLLQAALDRALPDQDNVSAALLHLPAPGEEPEAATLSHAVYDLPPVVKPPRPAPPPAARARPRWREPLALLGLAAALGATQPQAA
ncbi:MAG: MarR family transcriptional regulator, partial [Phycisphaerae bacterium]|nr:MarR family transcriptional regulator [Phycisphaerae bacterium]